MAAKGSFPKKVENNLHGFTIVLRSVACEWLLLFLLLLDATFSYFLTKFAQYCELQLPCLLCSRLDHVLGNEKPGFYRNLLCNDHKSEMSSLVLCHKHGKLADAHEMCEECLLSYAKKESSQEMYKFLLGKLGLDCLQKPFLSMDTGLCTRLCSCCSKPWRSRPNVHKMVQSRSSGPTTSKPDIPLPKSPGRRCLNRQEGIKKRKDRLRVGSPNYDSLCNVGYSEVKINSDSESEFLFSDEEDMKPLPRDLRRVKDDFLSQQDSRLSPRKQYEDVSHKSANMMNNHMQFSPISEKVEMGVPNFSASNGDVRHSFGQTNWQQIRQKAAPALSDLSSLDDISLSSNSPTSSPLGSIDEGDRVFHNNVLPSKNVQMPSRLSRESRANRKENGDIEHTPTTTNWESIDLYSIPTRKVDMLVPDTSTVEARDLAPSISKDVKLSEKLGRKDCNGIGPNEEPTTPKTPTLFADHPSLNIKNMILNGHADGAPSMIESPIRSRSPNIFSLESLETFTEIEGENLIDRLRRQAEHYKKCMTKLYKELEEERNASAISANQAMAMITKLQEEKAALNMEARQYLRMMDEQAEYDVDALERANDLLAEKEKELQDLEAELDYFRIKYPDDFPEFSDMQDDILDMGDALTSSLESINIGES